MKNIILISLFFLFTVSVQAKNKAMHVMYGLEYSISVNKKQEFSFDEEAFNSLSKKEKEKKLLAAAEEYQNVFCENSDSVAEVIMRSRQAGKPMADLYKSTNEIGLELDRKFIQELIKIAYTFPYYKTARESEFIVTQFRDIAFKGCLDRFNYKEQIEEDIKRGDIEF